MGMTTEHLGRELARQIHALAALVSQRETLTAKIQEIDTVMAAIQGM